MGFKFICSELGTLLFALDIMGKYHPEFESRKDLGVWFSETCIKTKYDKEILVKFSESRSYFDWGVLERIFHLSKDSAELKEILEEISPHKISQDIMGSVNHFKLRFNELYSKILRDLLTRKSAIESFTRGEQFKECLQLTEEFYCYPLKSPDIDVSILPSFIDYKNGGIAFNSLNKLRPLIYLETYNFKENNSEFIGKDVLVLLHELSHILFKLNGSKLSERIREVYKYENITMDEAQSLEEIFIRINFPDGNLSKLIKQGILPGLERKQNSKLTSFLKEKIKENKRLSDPGILSKSISLFRE